MIITLHSRTDRIQTRHIEAFSRKVTTTANTLIGDATNNTHYQNALSELHRELRRPGIQQRVFSYAQASPTELVRSKLSYSEIQHRALTYLPDELLKTIPADNNNYSLFQGFQATVPDDDIEHRKKHRRHGSRGPKLLEDVNATTDGPPALKQVEKERDKLNHEMEMMGIRKNMCSSEIREIDNKMSNLSNMRKIVLDRLSRLEEDELRVENELLVLEHNIEDMQDKLDDAATLNQAAKSPTGSEHVKDSKSEQDEKELDNMSASFMSASIYEKIPTPRAKRHKVSRRKSMPIRHEHFEPGTKIKELQAHNDTVTALDFDAPFGTMVTSALDDTVRVWDLNLGRCMGLLEGHQASVRCLQVEDNIVATGSMDATIRLWDLSKAEYNPDRGQLDGIVEREEHESDDDREPQIETPHTSSMQDCAMFSLEAHVAEVTALHFKGDTLISGSADKTLRQWDLVKGRCVQTLDVLWAAAQAASSVNSSTQPWRVTGRLPDASADFIGALQCFDAALACGTADGMVRLWDLRSGQVHRSLVGHTGPVTCLQFDDVHLITGSHDRSIRVSPSSDFKPTLMLIAADLGSSDRINTRCLRLRQSRNQHDVRHQTHRLCCWGKRGEGVRSDGRKTLGLRCRCYRRIRGYTPSHSGKSENQRRFPY